MLLCSGKAWIQTKLWPPQRNATSLWDSSGFETGKNARGVEPAGYTIPKPQYVYSLLRSFS